MTRLARCADCAKTYRVPHGDRVWRCRACDGELELRADPEAEAGAEQHVPCAECGEPNPEGSSFCGACGAEYPGSTPDRESQRDASAVLRKAGSRVKRLKGLLRGNIIVIAMLIAVVFYFLGVGQDGRISDDQQRAAFIGLGILAVSAGLNLVALRLVDRQPLAVVICLAGLMTLTSIWALSLGQLPFLLLFWTIAAWSLVPDAAAITKLTRQHPDLYVSRRLRGERGAGGRHEQRQQELDRRRNLQLLAGAGVLVILAAGWFGYRRSLRPQLPPQPTELLQRFEAAWNAGDIDAVAALKPEGERMARVLRRLQEHNEWGQQLPPLSDPAWSELYPGDDTVYVSFDCEGDELEVKLTLLDGAWTLASIFPGDVDWLPGP